MHTNGASGLTAAPLLPLPLLLALLALAGWQKSPRGSEAKAQQLECFQEAPLPQRSPAALQRARRTHCSCCCCWGDWPASVVAARWQRAGSLPVA